VLALTDALASRFSACTVQGELSGFAKAASGHCYFSLKDADGHDNLIRCAMFRRAAALLDFVPRDGQRVQVRGRVAVYAPRGELQFVVESMQAGTAGALMERFLKLKAALEAEGLFAPERKRALPAYPRRLGVLTSLGAAALHDVLSSLARRAPHVAVIVYPSLVQGPEAPAALARAVAQVSERCEVDTLLLCRGGGSLEDLWAFNDERVVRAIAASRVPVVCGVGHETDVTLADFAADLRAPTPTAAAELATPATAHCLAVLAQHAQRLQRRVRQRLDTQTQKVDHVALRWSRPAEWVRRAAQRLQSLTFRLSASSAQLQERQRQLLQRFASRIQAVPARAVQGLAQRDQRLATRLQSAQARALGERARRLQGLAARLQALDPEQVLRRGYAWVADDQGRPLSSVRGLSPGQALQAVLSDGGLGLRIESVRPDEPPSPTRS
jgi:exodeoxyribonuclease VII large subunit